MSQYNNINSGLDKYIEQLKKNTTNKYIDVKYEYINKNINTLVNIYGNSNIAWYGNDTEIQRRILHDIKGTNYTYNGKTYTGKNLIKNLEGKTIVEVTNEIDNSTYLNDKDEEGNDIITNLLQQYKMPTVEIIYIILE